MCDMIKTSMILSAVLYLPELLQQGAQMLVVSLGVGGGGPTVLQFRLQLKESAHVVGLLGG